MPARGDDFQIVLQIQFVFDVFFDVADDLSGRYDFGKNIFKPERLKDFFAELIFSRNDQLRSTRNGKLADFFARQKISE